MSRRTRRVLLVVLLLLLALIVLLLTRCPRSTPATVPKAAVIEPTPNTKAERSPPVAKPEEVLTAATVQVPQQVEAGAAFRATWTGPDNAGDFLTIVRADTKPETHGNYRETRHGASLELTAPMEPGNWEVRYVTAKSKTVLGRATTTVVPTTAVLTAADEVVLGAPLSIAWTGPGNAGDFICIVAKDAREDQVGNFAETVKGSPVIISAPVESGEAEIRYVSGQGRTILGRRKLVVLVPKVSVTAQASVIAGAKFQVTWKGPANAGDYVTVVTRKTPDGQYGSYAETAKGATLELVAPMEAGDAEIRYMTGKQAKVLARCPISVIAPTLTLEAPDEVIAGSAVAVVWTGPNNTHDYITIVAKATPDGQYGNYANTAKGSPLKVTAPIRPGASEIRYMSGSGAKVLARRPISIVPAEIVLNAPSETTARGVVTVEWKGPNHPGDYLTIVAKTAKDGVAGVMVFTTKSSPVNIPAPKEAGAGEIRYMSGQNNVVLARREIEVR